MDEAEAKRRRDLLVRAIKVLGDGKPHGRRDMFAGLEGTQWHYEAINVLLREGLIEVRGLEKRPDGRVERTFAATGKLDPNDALLRSMLFPKRFRIVQMSLPEDAEPPASAPVGGDAVPAGPADAPRRDRADEAPPSDSELLAALVNALPFVIDAIARIEKEALPPVIGAMARIEKRLADMAAKIDRVHGDLTG